VLFPSQSKSLTFTFKPNNLGVFHENVKFEMIKGSYQIPIHLYGKCAGISEK